MYDNSSRILDVSIDDILPNRFQPRLQFDEEEILELSDSIKEHGVIQPIVVRTVGDKYEIIAGERRYKASVLAGKETVPVIVKNLNDKDSAEIALIENVQRKNLTPIEEALSYKKILDMGYITQEKLAVKLGKSQSSIANKIRLLNLTDEVQEALLENKISERHARSLLKLNSSSLQNMMLDRIIKERLTVRRTDEEIEKIKIGDIKEPMKEEGEINMNNNIFGAASTPESTPTGFNIFETANSNPQMSSVPEAAPVPTFDIFAGAQTSTPTNQEQPQVATQPTMGGIQFDVQGNVTGYPAAQTVPAQQSVPTYQEQPQVATKPVMGGIQFDAEGNVIAYPGMQSVTEQPNESTYQEVQPVAPTTMTPEQSFSPIIENPTTVEPIIPIVDNNTQMTQESENLFSFGATNEPNMEPAVSMPEPIIITDYSKQYEPVMAQPTETPVSHADFKNVIDAIRECSSKIEQYGFKIDVEEYDLQNLYQVVFKVEK